MRALLLALILLCGCGKESIVVKCDDTVITAKLKEGAEPEYVRAAIEFSCRKLEGK